MRNLLSALGAYTEQGVTAVNSFPMTAKNSWAHAGNTAPFPRVRGA
jgi:hypothetical protein